MSDETAAIGVGQRLTSVEVIAYRSARIGLERSRHDLKP